VGTFKERAMETQDFREAAIRLLVDIGAVKMCRHDELVSADTSKESMAFALATKQIKDGKVDASLEQYKAIVGAVLAYANGGFCASCDKERRQA
jgi:hypothetical protein